jgi:DNA-binding NarL/FixJ family response regulator
MSKLKVVLADDHAMLREGLAALINVQEDMYVVAHASDGASTLQQVCEWQPDVVIMDLSMPHMGGIQTTAAIVREQPQSHILVLSRHSAPGYVRQALQAGARGYMLKQSVTTELLQAIRMVMTGTIYLDSTIASRIAQQLSEPGTPRGIAIPDLSEREADVVRLIAHGYSNKEIAARLDLSVKTVDTYKIRAMDKLDLYGRAALVRYALQQGWLDSEM